MEDECLLSWITAQAYDKMWEYHAWVTALKRLQEAAVSALGLAAYHKRGIAADAPPPKLQRKTVEEKVLVGAIIRDHVQAGSGPGTPG